MREFNTTLATEEITVDGDLYRICELTSAGRDLYLKAVSKTMQVKLIGTGVDNENGTEKLRKEITVIDLGGAQQILLQNTMVKVLEDGTQKRVTAAQTGGWGAKMVEELAKIASDLNGMDMPEEEALANAEKN